MWTFELIINSVGVTLILLAFFLLTIKKIRAESLLYNVLNLLGAGLACYGSWLIGAIPFTVLEGVWSVVALYGVWQALRPTKA